MRGAALANAANWLLIGLLQPKHRHGVFLWADFLVDAVFAAGFVVLAAWSRRGVLAAMAAFLVLGVANYASHLTEMRTWHRAFVTTSYLWAIGALASLAVATWQDDARRPRLSR